MRSSNSEGVILGKHTTEVLYDVTQIKVRGIAWKHRNIYSFSLLSTRAEQQVKSQGLREYLP